MMDSRLVDLNFREIINYEGQPCPVEVRYKTSPTCHGYCVSCEQSGVRQQAGGELDLMSHGCDSEDFETVLGPMPPSQDPEVTRPITDPVLFLLNEPGNARKNGKPIPYLGFMKEPPVNHYYWTPDCQGWPDWPCQVDQLNKNLYGPYFAYLMRRHQLRNVYITNQVKCRWRKRENGRGRQLVVKHCVNRFLKREVEIFAPKLALCFGKVAQRTFKKHIQSDIPHCQMVSLSHPARRGISREETVERNDRKINSYLQEWR